MNNSVTVVPEPAILLLLLPVLLLLGGLAVVVALLVFPKTRPLGIALLCVGVGGLFVMAMLVGWWRLAPSPHPMAATIARRDAPATRPAAPPVVLPDMPSAVPPPAAAKKAEAEPPAVIASRAVGMVEAIGQALSRMLTEEKKPPVAEKRDVKPVPALPPAKAPPAWVYAPPQVVGDSYQMSIVVGPWPTRQDCDADLPNELQKALDYYVEACEPTAGRVVLSAKYLRDHLVKEQWEEDIKSETESIGAMKQLHVLLRFDRDVKNRILDESRQGIVAGRLWTVGTGLAAAFWLLAVVYGYLRIDLATGGAYRGRLRFAAALAILGPVAAVLAVVV